VCGDVKEEGKNALMSTAMNLVIDKLNNNKSNALISAENVADLVYINDLDNSASLSETELMRVVNSTLFEFAFEYALTQGGDPMKVYEKVEVSSVHQDVQNLNLFPTDNSTIDEAQLSEILRKLDTNSDNNITREEIYDLFVTNKNRVVKPFLA